MTERREPTRPDLIARFEKLNMAARNFEAKYNLPANLIGKLRQGAYGAETPKSEALFQELEKALNIEEGNPTPARPGRPTRLESLSGDDLEERVQLAAFLSNAPDIITLDLGNQKIIGALLRGIITDTTARVLKEMAGERRQALIEKGKQEERAKAGDVLKVEIHNKADWSQPGPCPYCKGLGVLS